MKCKDCPWIGFNSNPPDHCFIFRDYMDPEGPICGPMEDFADRVTKERKTEEAKRIEAEMASIHKRVMELKGQREDTEVNGPRWVKIKRQLNEIARRNSPKQSE